MPPGVEDISIVERRSKVRTVEDVEEFCSKLNSERVGDALDVVVLEERKIEVQQARADQRVAAQVTPQIQASPRVRRGVARHGINVDYVNAIGCDGWRGRRNAEALRLNIVKRIARIHESAAAGTAHQIRHIDVGIGAFHAECVSRETRSKGHTSAGFENSAQLPPAQGP